MITSIGTNRYLCFVVLCVATIVILFTGFDYRKADILPIGQPLQMLTDKHIGTLTDINISRCLDYKPIDVVYTWVNGSDPEFVRSLDKYVALTIREKTFTGETQARRFKDSDELRFSLRSLEKFAPWVRHVYLVTNGQIPYWLNMDSPQVTLVSHEQIFGEMADQFLPTFSSVAIESQIFRIEGLADHFIYFNDDFFLGRPVFPDDFLTPSGKQKFYLDKAVLDSLSGICVNTQDLRNHDPTRRSGRNVLPTTELTDTQLDSSKCSPCCISAQWGNGICDLDCDVPSCAFDGGDCGVDKLLVPASRLFVVSPKTHADLIVDVPHYIVVVDWSGILHPGQELIFSNCSTGTSSAVVSSSFIASHSIYVVMANQNVPSVTYDCELSFTDETTYKLSVTFTASSKVEIANNDAFTASLRYVNELLDRDFGYAKRHKPAHVPTLFQLEIVHKLYERYRDEFLATASRRFRTPKDMKLYYSYIYYMLSLTLGNGADPEGAIDKLFHQEIDTDQSGDLSKAELMKLHRKAKAQLNWPAFFMSLKQKNCFVGSEKMPSNANSQEFNDGLMTLGDMKKCRPLQKLLLKLTNQTPVYKSEIELVGDEDSTELYSYVGIKTIGRVKGQLDELRRLRPKFFCLNNAVEDAETMSEAYTKVREFLLELFPQPSRFELPLGSDIPVTAISQLRKLRPRPSNFKLTALAVSLSSLACCYFCFSYRSRSAFKF